MTGSSNESKPFSQNEPNDLVKDLGLTKDAAWIFVFPKMVQKSWSLKRCWGNRLNKNLHPVMAFSWNKIKKKNVTLYFKKDWFISLMQMILRRNSTDYNAEEWRPEIIFKEIWEKILLPNRNKSTSITVAYSMHLKET